MDGWVGQSTLVFPHYSHFSFVSCSLRKIENTGDPTGQPCIAERRRMKDSPAADLQPDRMGIYEVMLAIPDFFAARNQAITLPHCALR